jgi:hypothetical protein
MDDGRWTMDDGRWTMGDGDGDGCHAERTAVILSEAKHLLSRNATNRRCAPSE